MLERAVQRLQPRLVDRKPEPAIPQSDESFVRRFSPADLDVVPVALNSGRFWARNGFLKRPGKIVVHFLPALARGLPRGSFMTKLEGEIETAMLSLDS